MDRRGEKREERVVDEVTDTMDETEGRTSMNSEETARLREVVTDLPEDSSQESETDLRAMGSTSDSVSGTAFRAAARGPWHVSTTATAKPKTFRKLEPHSAASVVHSFAPPYASDKKRVCRCLGVAKVIGRTR